MADLFQQHGIEAAPVQESKSVDLFEREGVTAPSIQERNSNAINSGVKLDAPVGEDQVFVADTVKQSVNQMEVLAKSRFSPDQLASFKNNPIKFGEVGKFLSYQDVIPAGGVYKAFDILTATKAAKKLEGGEELSVNEEDTLNKFVDKQIEMEMRGFSWGGGVAYGVAQMPAFMIEFAATGGVGKMAQVAAEKSLAKVAIKGAVAKTAGVVTNIAARTAVTPSMYTPKYAERRFNDFVSVTDKGDLILQQSEESPAKSALMAFGHTSAEVASEVSGAALGKYIVKPIGGAVGKYLKTPIASAAAKLPVAVRQGLYQAYKAINPNAKVSKVLSAAGWNGMIEELGEERVADVLHATLDIASKKEYTMDDYLKAITPSADQLMIEAGVIGVAGGARSSANIAFNILVDKLGDTAKAQETVDGMSANEQDQFVQKNLNIKGAKEQMSSWISGSVAVDEAGQPVTVYHGTASDFEEFDTRPEPRGVSSPQSVLGAWFTTSAERANNYAYDYKNITPKGGRIIPAYISLKKPYKMSMQELSDLTQQGADAFLSLRERLETEGYDGVIVPSTGSKDGITYAVFHPEQIRSAIAERVISDPIIAAQQNSAREADPPEINDEESGFNRFYREFVNGLQPIEDLSDAAQEKGGEIKSGQDPFILSRIYAGIVGHIQQNLEVGTTTFNEKTGQFDVNGKALKSIIDDFDNSVSHIEGSRDQREQDFNDYLIARRTLEDLKGREDVKVSEADLLKSAETMMRLASKYGEELKWFDEFAVEMYEYQKRILQNLVDAGVMSQEIYDGILTKNPNYIPFQRVFEESEDIKGMVTNKGVFTNAAAGKVIKKIHGSEKEIKNVVQSVIANTAKILDLAQRNRVAKSIVDLENLMPEYIQKVKPQMQEVMVDGEKRTVPSELAPRDTITVFINGKKKYYRVSKPLLEAVNNLSPMQFNATMQMLLAPFKFSASLLRAGATIIPEFWIRNVLRDQGTAFLQSPVRPTPIDMVKGLASVIGRGDLYNEWMRNGGSFNSYMDLDDKGLEKAYRELFRPKGKFASYLRNPLQVLNDISVALEQGTRVGVFAKARRMGIEGIEAALISREATLDFARGGTVAKNINQYVPFFNAGVQSVDKLIRTFKENPKATAFWGMATITVPSVILTGFYLYAAPDDEREEYLEIPQWQKDMFWIFKQDGQWRRIPKPFSFGYLFGSVPERFMLWAYQGDKPEMKKFWQEFSLGVAGTISPVYDASAIFPPLVKVAIEDLTNYNFFTGRSIYPEWMERYEPEERKNKYTTETADVVGRAIGVSPALVDNTLRGALAGSANYVTDAGDAVFNAVKKWNGEDVPEKPTTQADTPVIKAFTVREPTGYGANSVSNFFDDWKKVSEVNATKGHLDGEEKSAYMERNAKTLQSYKRMKGYYDQIRSIGKQSDLVYSDMEMSSKDKVERLSEYGDQILNVAKDANKWYAEQSVSIP